MTIVDRRLFLTADKESLVEEDDPSAAFLWAPKGREVPDAEAERLGYTPLDTEEKEADAPEDKSVPEPEADKAVKPKRRSRKAG